MNIVVDENIPRRTVEALRAMGHQVIDIRGTSEEGSEDEDLWKKAQEERAHERQWQEHNQYNGRHDTVRSLLLFGGKTRR